MDYQFMEMNSEIYVELPRGSVIAHRVDAHSTRVRIDNGMESYIRIFTSKNRVMIKAIANVSAEVQLLVPPGVKAITVEGGDTRVEMYDFSLDAFSYKGGGDMVLKGMEIRKLCEIENEGGKIEMRNSFLRGVNFQSCGGRLDAEKVCLRGSNTLYVEKCRVNMSLVGMSDSYNIKAMGGVTPDQVMVNDSFLSELDTKKKNDMNWIIVAGAVDKAHPVKFTLMDDQKAKSAAEKARLEREMELALEKALIEKTLNRES